VQILAIIMTTATLVWMTERPSLLRAVVSLGMIVMDLVVAGKCL